MNDRLYNGVSIFFLAMTLVAVVFFVFRFTQPASDNGGAVAAVPTAKVLPTFTPEPPTITPRPSLPPTFTLTPTDTATPTNTLTSTPVDTLPPPSPTITDTAGAPAETATPQFTDTPAPSNTPSGPTLTYTATDSPFLFDLRDNIIYQPNNANQAGCAWQGVGGQVLDQNALEINRQFQVRVFGEGFESTSLTGTNSTFGSVSGWEVPITTQIVARTYYIRLETVFGTAISPDFQVTFPGDCTQNLAIIRFYQVQQFP